MTQYVCTFVEKRVEKDDYEKGCDGSARTVMQDRVNLRSDTLGGLIDVIRDYYGLALDDLFIPGEDDEPVTRFGFNRLEDADGNPPTKSEEAHWRKGKYTLYLADYDFIVERRETSPIDPAEFAALGITTH